MMCVSVFHRISSFSGGLLHCPHHKEKAVSKHTHTLEYSARLQQVNILSHCEPTYMYIRTHQSLFFTTNIYVLY